jgi:hypothetical protein
MTTLRGVPQPKEVCQLIDPKFTLYHTANSNLIKKLYFSDIFGVF